MASRELSFLIRPHEFETIINEIIISLKLHAIHAEGGKVPIVKNLTLPLTLKYLNQFPVCIFFLSESAIPKNTIFSDICFPKNGWIQVIVSRERNGMLNEGRIAIKTDWYVGDEKFENKEGLVFFDKVKRALKKYLQFSAYSYYVPTGDSSPCKIGYTEKTKEFEKQGGLLVQSGDDGFYSTRFVIDKQYIRVDPDLVAKRTKYRETKKNTST